MSAERRRRQGGFTLIELLTVIAIAGLLLGLSWMGFRGIRAQALDARCKGNLKVLFAGMGTYASEWGHWPTAGRETPAAPAIYGNHPWFYSLLVQGYIPTRKENRGGYDCLVSDALICPANEYAGGRYPYTSAPFPWRPNYAMSNRWGDNQGVSGAVGGYIDRVRTLGGIVNVNAIILVDTTSTWGINDYYSDWSKEYCLIPRNLHGQGVNALLANGAVINVSPASHPDLQKQKYWDPRYAP